MTDLNYDRPKSVVINDTPIALTWEAAEAPGSEAAVVSGSTAQLTATLIADADESGGADLQDLFTITISPAIDDVTGRITMVVVVTPVAGGGDDEPAVTLETVEHPQTMDAWQAAAGRARQA